MRTGQPHRGHRMRFVGMHHIESVISCEIKNLERGESSRGIVAARNEP